MESTCDLEMDRETILSKHRCPSPDVQVEVSSEEGASPCRLSVADHFRSPSSQDLRVYTHTYLRAYGVSCVGGTHAHASYEYTAREDGNAETVDLIDLDDEAEDRALLYYLSASGPSGWTCATRPLASGRRGEDHREGQTDRGGRARCIDCHPPAAFAFPLSPSFSLSLSSYRAPRTRKQK